MTPSATNDGERALSPRQMEAIRLYAELGSVKAVAHAMGISFQVTKNHLAAVYSRLGVQTNIDAFRALGWLEPDPAHRVIRRITIIWYASGKVAVDES